MPALLACLVTQQSLGSSLWDVNQGQGLSLVAALTQQAVGVQASGQGLGFCYLAWALEGLVGGLLDS